MSGVRYDRCMALGECMESEIMGCIESIVSNRSILPINIGFILMLTLNQQDVDILVLTFNISQMWAR